jgi:(2Fe-2S) ferredoxin
VNILSKDQYIFFCCNVKEDGRKCCGSVQTEALYDYCKQKVQVIKAKRSAMDKNVIKVNKSGCLGKCSLGPNAVVFPDNRWYRCESESDVDRILDSVI